MALPSFCLSFTDKSVRKDLGLGVLGPRGTSTSTSLHRAFEYLSLTHDIYLLHITRLFFSPAVHTLFSRALNNLCKNILKTKMVGGNINRAMKCVNGSAAATTAAELKAISTYKTCVLDGGCIGEPNIVYPCGNPVENTACPASQAKINMMTTNLTINNTAFALCMMDYPPSRSGCDRSCANILGRMDCHIKAGASPAVADATFCHYMFQTKMGTIADAKSEYPNNCGLGRYDKAAADKAEADKANKAKGKDKVKLNAAPATSAAGAGASLVAVIAMLWMGM